MLRGGAVGDALGGFVSDSRFEWSSPGTSYGLVNPQRGYATCALVAHRRAWSTASCGDFGRSWLLTVTPEPVSVARTARSQRCSRSQWSPRNFGDSFEPLPGVDLQAPPVAGVKVWCAPGPASGWRC